MRIEILVLLLDAVVGQVREGIPEIVQIVSRRGGPQHTLAQERHHAKHEVRTARVTWSMTWPMTWSMTWLYIEGVVQQGSGEASPAVLF